MPETTISIGSPPSSKNNSNIILPPIVVESQLLNISISSLPIPHFHDQNQLTVSQSSSDPPTPVSMPSPATQSPIIQSLMSTAHSHGQISAHYHTDSLKPIIPLYPPPPVLPPPSIMGLSKLPLSTQMAPTLHQIPKPDHPNEFPPAFSPSQLPNYKPILSSHHHADNSYAQLNSYKFPRPRHYIRNDYTSSNLSHIDHLQFISINAGPKQRTSPYNSMLSNLLQSSNPHKTKPPKKRQVSLNNIDFHSPTLKAIHLTIEQHRIPALIDTGSTHNLISVTSFQKLKNTTFTPISMNMQVAGATLKNNIIGKTILLTTFDSHPIKISLPITFLIAHAINNYECILGSEILYNPSIIRTLTHDFITFSSKFKKATAPIHNIIKNSSFNFLTCVHPTVLEPYQTLSVPVHTQFPSNHFHLISSQPLIPCLTLSTLHPITDTISNLTITNSSPLPVQLNNTDIFSSVQLLANSTIKPHINTDTAPSLHIQNPQTLVSKPAQLQSINATHKTDHSDPPSLDIDEEILQDHTLIDSTQLDAQFSYKDCQINNDLPHKIKKKLEQTISAYQSVFAKTN